MTSFAPGIRLGPYQILEPIGAGGMGEVYKATDTRLDRTVAIKVLPHHWAANAEMRQRFEREAQTLASLNHPHICVLHDIGSQDGADYLVMEHLEGETVAARLERGAIPLDEALKVALEIADALDKAHRRGVVHRDLKPSNVMLTKSGTKLLDFGLAKWANRGRSSSVADAPTAALPTGKDLTTPGTVLGTLQYMAPEQLEGLEADARTDIFAFGALLHEMVTGKKAFDAKSRVLLIAAIATSEPPPLSSVEPTAPAALDHVVRVCLAKEPADRWQTARDLLAELEWVSTDDREAGVSAAPAGAATGKRMWAYRALVAAGSLAAAVMAAAGSVYFGGPEQADEFRFRVPIQLSEESAVAGGNGANPAAVVGFRGVSGPQVFNPVNFAISPDGRALAFVARPDGLVSTPWVLYVRPAGAVTPKRLDGTDGAALPFWSADSRSIAFVADGKLKRIEASGGPPQEICPTAADFSGGAWNSDGVILFGSTQGLQRVSAEGGKPEPVTKLAESEVGHYWPLFLPGGRRFLYTAWSSQADKRGIVAGALDSPEQRTRVLPIGSNAGYAEPGYLVFHRDSAVYAQPFDAGALSVSGEPVRIADEISSTADRGKGHFSVASTGALAYFFGPGLTVGAGVPATDLSEWQLSWMNRTTGELKPVGGPGAYRGVDVSPDATRVAVHRHDANGGDVIVFEPQGSEKRLTFDAKQHNSMPIWSPDGTLIVFASLRNGKWGLYQTLSTRSGTEEKLFESDLPAAPMSWVGKHIVFWVQDPKAAGDIWVLTTDDKKAEKLIATPFNETHPQISPDGKWLAYTSNSKDDRREIYVRPFPSGTDLYQISDNGGDWPRWRSDSKELFYHSLGVFQNPSVTGNPAFGGPMYSVLLSVKGSVLEREPPRPIRGFPALNIPHSGGSYHTYAVDPTDRKGERFLVMQFVPPASFATPAQLGPDTSSGLTVALGWTSALRK